jgi:replication factor A1
VIEETQGIYRCEACNKTFQNSVPTYMIIAKITDFTDSIYVNFAREHGTAIMGMSAREYKEMRDCGDSETLNAFFDTLLFRPFNIMIKGKYEYYNNENRMRYFAVKVMPHIIPTENKALIKRLDMYKLMQSV